MHAIRVNKWLDKHTVPCYVVAMVVKVSCDSAAHPTPIGASPNKCIEVAYTALYPNKLVNCLTQRAGACT